MLDKWHELIFSLIKTNASLGEFRNVLLKMKAEGTTASAAQLFFEDIRNKMISEDNEKGEDRILEVLDIITGYCSPHLMVW